MVLTWLHLSRRDELSTYPEEDMSQPLTGVFSTCSPNRPKPIGLHRAHIAARDELRIEVDALEAMDGTPVVDVKPAIPARMTRCTRPIALGRTMRLRPGPPPPIAERGRRSGGSHAKSRLCSPARSPPVAPDALRKSILRTMLDLTAQRKFVLAEQARYEGRGLHADMDRPTFFG